MNAFERGFMNKVAQLNKEGKSFLGINSHGLREMAEDVSEYLTGIVSSTKGLLGIETTLPKKYDTIKNRVYEVGMLESTPAEGFVTGMKIPYHPNAATRKTREAMALRRSHLKSGRGALKEGVSPEKREQWMKDVIIETMHASGKPTTHEKLYDRLGIFS